MIIISEVKIKSKISSSPSTLPRRRQRQYFVSFDKIYSSIFTCSLQDKLLLIVDLPGRSSTSPCFPLTDSPRTPWPRCSPRRPADRNVGKEITRLFYEELLADIIAKSYLGESKTRNKEKFKDPPLDSQS